jgi:hypothetical protein
MHKVFLIKKKGNKNYSEIEFMEFLQNMVKKLGILPIPSLYIYSLMLFFVDNLYYLQANASIHDINIRYKNQLTHTLS